MPYEALGCNISLKNIVLHSHLDLFSSKLCMLAMNMKSAFSRSLKRRRKDITENDIHHSLQTFVGIFKRT